MTDLMLPATPNTGLERINQRPNAAALALAPDLHLSETLAATSWKMLAPLMAAQATMRLWNPVVRFNESTALTKALPDKPAAVPMFWRARTRLIALDLDSKHFGTRAVTEDLESILVLLKDCGIRAVTDLSVSGGAHVLIPLELAMTVSELEPLLAALAARYRTVDLKPMLNDTEFGCITVPGSRCREGGFRVLQGSLAAAGEAFRLRNSPEVIARLAADLGVVPVIDKAGLDDAAVPAGIFLGTGDYRRLHPRFRMSGPIPDVVEAFAAEGVLAADGRWPSPSEARQSALVHALGRGMSLIEVTQLIARGQRWHHGLGQAYRRYKYDRTAHRALKRDWDKAIDWHKARATSFLESTHKTAHTGAPIRSPLHSRWLAHSVHWADLSLRSHGRRWAVVAVLQALAVLAAQQGTIKNGTAVVAVGVRSLSLAAGLMSKETVAETLHFLRDTPGSPVLHSKKTSGAAPDEYALVAPHVPEPAVGSVSAPELIEVHMSWWIVGLGHRRIYETVSHSGGGAIDDIAASAKVSKTAAYTSVAELCRVGLLTRADTGVGLGEKTLDQIAHEQRLAEVRAERIEEYRCQRKDWHDWLDGNRAVPLIEHEPVLDTVEQVFVDVVLSAADEEDRLKAVMATGPPTRDEDQPVSVLPRGARRHRRWWWTDTNAW